jgi:hypothetical protein
VHGRLAACDFRDHLPQLLHRLRLAEQLEGSGRDHRLRHVVRLAVVITQLQRRCDQLAQRREIERLRDEIERAELERPHGRFDVAVRRDHGDGNAGPVMLDPLHDAEAVAVRQPHVGEHEVKAFGAKSLDRIRAVAGRLDLDLHATERDREKFADVGLVVDDQRARFGSAVGHHPSQRRGSAKMMRKMLPPPGRGS